MHTALARLRVKGRVEGVYETSPRHRSYTTRQKFHARPPNPSIKWGRYVVRWWKTSQRAFRCTVKQHTYTCTHIRRSILDQTPCRYHRGKHASYFRTYTYSDSRKYSNIFRNFLCTYHIEHFEISLTHTTHWQDQIWKYIHYKIFVGSIHFANITKVFALSIIHYTIKPQYAARPFCLKLLSMLCIMKCSTIFVSHCIYIYYGRLSTRTVFNTNFLSLVLFCACCIINLLRCLHRMC